MRKLLIIILVLNMLLLPSFAIIEDDFVNATLDKNLKIKKPQETVISNEIPVKIRIKDELTTKIRPVEGDYIEFETVEAFKSFPAGTTVKGRIEYLSMNFTWGVPADIIVSNFKIGNKPLYGEIKSTGADRTLWLRPVIILSTLLGGIGVVLIPIRGGHAKIKTDKIYTVYYR